MYISLSQEIRIIGYLRLKVRLDVLISAAMCYQKALLSLRKCENDLIEAGAAVAECERFSGHLPEELGLERLAGVRYKTAQENLVTAKAGLAKATEDLCDTTHPATQLILALLEEHEHKLDAIKLRAALDHEAGAAAARS